MTETAAVIEVKDDVAILACPDSESCSSCAAHGICGGAKDRQFEAFNINQINLEKGDVVEVLLPTGKTIGAAFMVMLFPLILFLLFFGATGLILENPEEGVKVLSGVVGLAAGFGINLLLNRKQKKKNLPQIIKKLY
ncbi:MAG: SoxR reducing system RseC family protein [Spirochaetales bacterium]|nr:SoxR reducing system RseC family protein [Spirochaetales bacterium]